MNNFPLILLIYFMPSISITDLLPHSFPLYVGPSIGHTSSMVRIGVWDSLIFMFEYCTTSLIFLFEIKNLVLQIASEVWLLTSFPLLPSFL